MTLKEQESDGDGNQMITGLAKYAAHDAESRGRIYAEPSPQYRSAFQRDRDRIVHSAAFRRLVYKTQVFVNHEGDMYRTRLTHSLEVAQIGRSIAHALRLNEHLVEAIALAHDLGHTAFGHAGQDALNSCMRDYDGFEHNLQSLRVVDTLEEKYADFPGLNLSFETREGILKHCSAKNARLLGDLGERFLNRKQAGLEAQLTDLADAVAYNNHDVDDGLRAGLLSIEELRTVPLFCDCHDAVIDRYPNLDGRRMIHETVRRMISHVVKDLIEHTQKNLDALRPQSIDDVRNAGHVLVCFSEEVAIEHLELKRFLMKALYQHPKVVRMTDQSHEIIVKLFETYMKDIRLLPNGHSETAKCFEADEGEKGKARAIADYIAGMTDRFAISEYERLVPPAMGS